jgi:hypothetical protein
LTDANVAALVAGLRIPFVIGVGQEQLQVSDLEMVRGSSSSLDQQIINEDVSAEWIVDSTNPSNPILGAQDGTRTQFRVRNTPVVDGQGFGKVTNDVRNVSVTVNGSPVAVGAVNGSSGIITLQVPPQPNDTVRVTYFFHRADTAFTDDVSSQVSENPQTIITPGFEPYNIITGANDTFQVTLNGGALRTVVFQAAPAATAASLVTQITAALGVGVASVFVDNIGVNHLKLTAVSSILIGTGNANGILGLSGNQFVSGNTQFRVFQRPIVDGTSGGITTTDTSKVVVKVNNVQVIPSAVDGTNGVVTLTLAPPPGATVTINYWANTWQDTFDYLPNPLVTSVIRAGISPGRSDYIQGADFVIKNPTPDVSIVHWGTSYSVSSTLQTPGATPFDSTQIIPTLVDDKMYLAPCTRFADTSVIPAVISNTVFLLPEVPTTGNGRDTVLGSALFSSVTNSRQDVVTNRPDLVIARVGRTLSDALGRPAATVTTVDGVNRKITLRDPIPADWNVFATFYYNRISDDTYILTNTVAGPVGAGQYNVFSSLLNTNLYQVRFGTKSALSEIVQWPRGVEYIPDALYTGSGVPVSETVTVTFGQAPARNAVYTNEGAQPYSFYTASASWITNVNGTPVTTNLLTAQKATLVSQAVTLVGGNITITTGVNDTLALIVDGVSVTATLAGGAQAPSAIVTTINAAIDAALAVEQLTSTGWVTGVGWSGAYNAFTHSSGTATLTNTLAADGTSDYIVTVTITYASTPAGSVTVDFGGDTHAAISNTTTYTLTSTTTGSLAITPLTAFNGTIAVSVKKVVINTLASAVSAFGGTAAFFVIKSNTTPTAISPGVYGGFDAVSSVYIAQGTAETLLGFRTFEQALGTTGSINKPATILGSSAEPFTVIPSVNDTFQVRINGVDFTSTLTNEITPTTGWVLGTGWAGPYPTFTHTAGNTATLTNPMAAIVGAIYEVVLTVVPTAGTVGVGLSFGGTTETSVNATTTYTITASTVASLVITPDTTFAGTVSIDIQSKSAGVIASQINSVVTSQGSATDGTLTNLGKIRITSNTNQTQSAVLIGAGTANTLLGFSQGSFASQTLVTAQEVVDSLMGTGGFTGAVAYPSTINGQTYVTIESLTTGITSSIGFSTATAFNTLTGTGIVPGVSGDNGEAVTDNFAVTSSDVVNGSSGTGYPGQTYTDARTGLRFTVLPATTGHYDTAGSFTLLASQTFAVNPGVPFYSIPGLETTVANTVGVGVNDTANVETFNPSGVEPANGDFYFISYYYMKQDFSTKLYSQFKTIEGVYGPLNAENRVTLGAYLAILNGAVLVGIKQVLKVPNTNQASAQSFITAIQGLATPLPGNIKPDVIVPLSTDTAVYSYLTQHCEVMSNIRNQSERMGMIGFASGTTPTVAQTIAKSLFSSRIVALYPDSVVVTFTDELGNTFQSLVDGTFFAAAVAGAVCSPAVDVATPYTRRQLQGFTQIPRIMDPVEANQTATAGITILEDLQPIIRIRQGLTTNMTNILTRLPTVTQIADYVSISSRSVLDAYVGTKFLSSRTNEVEVSMTSLFKQLIQQEIVSAFTGIAATVDPNDPTILNATAYWAPIFPLLYLVLTFNLRARI